jgi:hypothetical protein
MLCLPVYSTFQYQRTIWLLLAAVAVVETMTLTMAVGAVVVAVIG